jgi:hypothetical protein
MGGEKGGKGKAPAPKAAPKMGGGKGGRGKGC